MEGFSNKLGLLTRAIIHRLATLHTQARPPTSPLPANQKGCLAGDMTSVMLNHKLDLLTQKALQRPDYLAHPGAPAQSCCLSGRLWLRLGFAISWAS